MILYGDPRRALCRTCGTHDSLIRWKSRGEVLPAELSRRLDVVQRAFSPQLLKTGGTSQAWSMDFVHDQLVTGRAFRVLTVIDQWSRESVLMEANVALTGQSVVDALEALSAGRPLPKAITVDHGTNSRPRRWTNGRTNAGWPWISSGPESRWRTRFSRASTAVFVTNA